MNDSIFVTADPASHAALREATTAVVDALARSAALPGPRCARSPGGDAVNIRVHRDLFASGEAVIGRTRVGGAVALKLTLLNPLTTPTDVDALLEAIVSAAA
jgi:glutamate/tyrosine decarboxylase-like PLP-dependent enzyme